MAAPLRTLALAAALLPNAAACTADPDLRAPLPQHPSAPAVPTAPPGGASGVMPTGMRPAKPEGHIASTVCLSFSPDGREIVSGSQDRTLLVWDVESGRVVQRLEGHKGFVGANACAFLPDGRRLVSAGWGGEVFVWDRATGKRVQRLSGLDAADSVYSLAVRPDGREVMVGSYEGRATAWELTAGDGPSFDNEDLRHSPKKKVWTIGYLDDGRRFGGGDAGKLLIWGKGAAKEIALRPTSALPLSGGRLLLGSERALHIVEANGKDRKIADYEGWIYGLAVNPRRDVAVAGDDAGNTRVWNLASGTQRCVLPKGDGIWAAAFDPSGDRFAVAGDDASVLIARASDCTPLRRLEANRGRVSSVAAGASVFLGDGSGNMSTWTVGDFRVSLVVPMHAGEVTALAALADGTWASGGSDKAIFAGSQDKTHKIGTLRGVPWRILPLPGEAAVLTVDMSGDTKMMPMAGGQPKAIFSTGGADLYGAAIRPGKAELVVGGVVPGIHKLTLPQGSKVDVWPKANPISSVTALAYSPDGARLAEGSTAGDVALRDPDTGTIARRLAGLRSQVSGLVFTPTHLWAGGADQKLLRWPLFAGTDPDRTIPETSSIHDLTSTPDGRYLIAALDDGAMVHALPDGEPIARLIPFRDRSWATLYTDGRFVASAGAALSLRVENPSTRQVAILGKPFEPASIGTPSATRLASGHARIRTTVFSYSGPPRVRLDDRWDLVSVTPSDGNLAAYDVDVLLNDTSSRPHRITIIPPEGAPVTRDFAPPSIIQSAKALVIGNGAYRHPGVPKLPGATKDANDVARALQSADTWHLPKDRVLARTDLDGAALARETRAFFEGASPEDTLLFYYAGHGDRDGKDGYLLSVDHTPGDAQTRLSATELWKLIEASKAERVLVILDACRAGSFLFPEGASARAESTQKPIAFLSSTNASTLAQDTARGGPFTQAILKALFRVESVAAHAGAVTVQSAYHLALGEAGDQNPRLRGTLDQLPLAWPRDPNVKPTSTALATTGALEGTGIAEVTASLDKLETRQISGSVEVKQNARERILQVRALLGEEAQSIRVGVYYFDEPKRAEVEVFHDGAFRDGQRVKIAVPLREGLRPGTYQVHVQACGPKAACGGHAPAKFQVEL